MSVRNQESKRLQALYERPGNQMVILYGRTDSGRHHLLRNFCKDKKFFYYEGRKVAPFEQRRMMQQEIEKKYDLKINEASYYTFFKRIRSGDASKLILIINEFQYLMKKDEDFFDALIKLKEKRLYPGPVMIILTSSSLVWCEHKLADFLGDKKKKINETIKLEDLQFLDVVRKFPKYDVSQCVEVYGILGGVEGYLRGWDETCDTRSNVIRHILSKEGFLFSEPNRYISSELRELSVYNTILLAIANGHHKLNDLYHYTGFSRAKISVYIKNLMEFDVVEKVVSFETGGWDNAQKGIYQIRNHFLNFYYRFIFPNASSLYVMPPEEFYDTYIAKELESYLNRFFVDVCMEYLKLLNQIGKLPLQIHKMGSWVGKTGTIDILGQNAARENLVGICNWSQTCLTYEQCMELYKNMEKAKIKAKHYYLFSAKSFDEKIKTLEKEDSVFHYIDMTEL